MAEHFVYRFAWDPAKAAGNRSKHGITFEQAATVFRDPLALSLLVRLISAREATPHERKQYQSGHGR